MTRFLFSVMSVFLGLLLTSCGGGGGGEPAQTTVNLRETADYAIADAVQVVERSSVVGVQADPDNAGRTQAILNGTGYRVGQIVTVPQPVGSTEMFPAVGEVVSVSEKNGTSTLGLVPAPLNRVYKSLSLNLDTQRDAFKILKVVTAAPLGGETLDRKSRLDARRSGQIKFTNEVSETGADGLITLKRAFEIPIEGNKKLSATLNMDKLKATKIVQMRPGCSQPGCTMNEIGAYDQVATSISGDWSVEFSLDGDEFPGGIPISLSSLIDTKQMWKNLKRELGPWVLTGLDGADKEGLIPIFGLVLVSNNLPPFSPIPVTGGTLDRLSGATVLMVVYIKLDGSMKLKGSFTPIFARGKINQSISMRPGQSQGELVGTTQNIDQAPTSAGTRVNGALEVKGVIGVAVSADLIVGGVRPLSVTSELLAVERTQSYIGTAELVWYPEVSLSGYYCSKGQTRVYSSFGIAGAASLGLKSLDGEKVAELGGDFNWKRSKDWYQIPSGDNKCSSVTPPVVAVSELGQGTGTQAGKKAVGFNYASTPDALKLMADSWIVNVLSPGGRSLVTEPRAGTPEQLVGYVDAGVAHQFTVTAYSSTYGDIAVSPPINFTTTPLAPQHIPVSISGLSATQTQPGGAVAGGFTVEGSDVQAIRVAVRVLNSNTPVPACWTNLRPQLGYRGFSFSGDWGGTAGACAALMPAQGESRTLEFLFEVTDSKGNSAGVCSAPPGGGPGECTSPVVRVLVQGVSVNPVTCSTGSAPDPDGICRAIATATSVSPAAGMIGVDKEFVISGTNFPSTAAVAIQDAYCWAPYLRTTTTIKIFCNLAGARGAKRVTVKTDTAANGGIVISDSMLVQANGSSLQEIQSNDFSLLPPVGDETFIFQTLRIYSNLEIFGGSVSNGQNILFGNYSFGKQNPNPITQYIEITNARGEVSVFSNRPSTYISPKNIYIAEINPVVLFPESGVYRVKIYALEDVSGNRSETISWTIQVARNQTGAYSLSDQGHYFASMCFADAVRAACDVPIAARFGVGVANGSAGMVPRLVLMSERPRISLDMRPIIGDYFNNWGVDFTRTSSDPLEGYIQNPATGKSMGYFRIYGTDAFIPKPN